MRNDGRGEGEGKVGDVVMWWNEKWKARGGREVGAENEGEKRENFG